MVKFVSFHGGKFGTEFVDKKIIRFILVLVTENHGVAKVHSIRKQVRHRKNVFNLRSGGTIDILTENDGGFMEIRNLDREEGEVMENGIDCGCLSHRSLTTEDLVIRKKE